jgi:LysM repeat protein
VIEEGAAMALPSQQDRAGGNRSSIHAMPRKGIRPRAVLAVVAVVVLGGVVTWGLYRITSGRGTDASPRDPLAATTGPGVDVPIRFGEGAPSTGHDRSETPRPPPVDVVSPPASTPGDSALAPPPPPPTETTPVLPPTASISEIRALIDEGDRAMARNEPVRARELYSRALLDPRAARSDQEVLRTKLTALGRQLVFSPDVTPGDPYAELYVVQPGDSLVRIARRRELTVDWRFIQRINGIGDPNTIRAGQKLKLVRGPFNAVVHKSDYRLDLFLGPPDLPDQWLFVRSFRVGLGADDATPTGTFVVKKNSKLINPAWTNPLTGERFAADDPKNPVGEHWIGWQGLGDSAIHTGFGIHGTIEPDSIGQSRSMGCVRMLADDVALVYELLAEEISVIRVVP